MLKNTENKYENNNKFDYLRFQCNPRIAQDCILRGNSRVTVSFGNVSNVVLLTFFLSP